MDTFEEFCRKNEMPLVLKVWINPYTSFGYGFLNVVPAAYVLQYLDIPTMKDFLNRNFISWEKGAESIWRN
ncbi:MAG: hypothetical protein PHX70_08920 [Clostridium sp.]|nr:hypothetical protein [Clostridium sp.]